MGGIKETTQVKQRDEQVFEPLEQGNKAPGNLEESDSKIHEKSYDGEGARLHITHCSRHRTDIFITEKKTDEVRAGSIRPELVQGFELEQP